MKNKEVFETTIMYEDVVKNPKEELTKILDTIHLSHECLIDAMKQMEFDSQNGLVVHRGENVKIEKDFKTKEIDQLLKLYDLHMTCDMNIEEFRKLIKLHKE